MINKASSKTRASTKKRASAKSRAQTPAPAKRRASATVGGGATRTTTKARASAGKRASARRAPAAEAMSPALELEELFSTTQSKLVVAWQKETNAAVKALEGLQKKLDRAVERQRKLKDKRIAAATRYREKRSAATGARLEKAKLAYTEAAAVVVEFRDLTKAARGHMRATKLALARALARDKILTRFASDYVKAQAAKTKGGTRRKTRNTAPRAAQQDEGPPSGEEVPSTSEAVPSTSQGVPSASEAVPSASQGVPSASEADQKEDEPSPAVVEKI